VYFFKDIIVDRGSHYSVFGAPISSREEAKDIIKNIKKQEYFDKATHNSYAFRLRAEHGIIEGKNDDGETGAGMCILRELERENAVNMIVVVTRYF
jgi:putative IMPACT (imprinted ancient) family translation regulator